MAEKVFEEINANGERRYLIECPGCGCLHYFDNRWKFSGNKEKPTFYPSLIVKDHEKYCHMFVAAGRIYFLEDCTHDLAGKTVDMLDWQR
jgi:hypothetical protein